MTFAFVAAKIAHWGWPKAGELGVWLTDVGVSAHRDVLVACGLGLVAQLLLTATRSWPRAQRWLWGVGLGIGAFLVVYAVASIQIFTFLRSPLTYPLLYLAGDAKNMSSSIKSFISPGIAAAFVWLPLVFLVGSIRGRSWRLPPTRGGRLARVALASLALVYVGWGTHVAGGRWSDRSDRLIVLNPHWTFVESLAQVARGGGMPAFHESYPSAYRLDFAPFGEEGVTHVTRSFKGRAARNAIVLLLESTGTYYLSWYGSKYQSTPRLEAEAARSFVVEGMYSNVGLTANAMATFGLSVYPFITWREYTLEYPHYPGQTAADVLRPRGYRTLFIHNGHLDYVGQDRFLQNRGYDNVWDWKDLSDAPPVSSWGGEDRVLFERLLEWIDRDRSKPFYVTAWTIGTHHPYEPVPGQEMIDFFKGDLPPDDYDLGRYLNTVHETDKHLGWFLDALRERGLADDTVVLVTGDHGQGFGSPHPTWGHGFRVYQENVQVPLLLWNSRLFGTPERRQIVAGHVDINPTITDILDVPPSPTWQGRSLFAPDRPGRAYFYAVNDDYLLGVREGDWKYIYNATRGKEELFDLAKDPEEQKSVAPAHPEVCRTLRQRLAAWKDDVGERLAKLNEPGSPN